MLGQCVINVSIAKAETWSSQGKLGAGLLPHSLLLGLTEPRSVPFPTSSFAPHALTRAGFPMETP